MAFGLFLAIAFPPVGFWPAAVAAPIPLVWVIEQGRSRPARWAVWAAVGVLPFWLLQQSWVIHVSAAGYVPMCLYLAAFTWLTCWAGARIRRRFEAWPAALLAPIVWVAVDFLRGRVLFNGYPWYFASHPLIDAPWLAWPASLLGVYAVTFMVVALGGAVLDLRSAVPRRRRAGMIALGLAVIWALAGAGWMSAGRSMPTTSLARLGVVQTNVPQDNKIGWSIPQRLADWSRFEALLRQAAASQPPPDLLVLPETMFPGWTLDPKSLAAERAADLAWNDLEPPRPTTYFADRLLDLQRETGIPMLVGSLGYDGFRFDRSPEGGWRIAYDAMYNSALVVDQGAVAPERYDKIDLTPFGEEMPYISLWPWLQERVLAIGASGMSFDLSKGKRPVVLRVRRGGGEIRVATPICFEATMPEACRALVFEGGQRRADLLVNLTNDGWFGAWDAGRRQHMQLARWRCLELATPMVRAANTGMSALIDAQGRLLRAGVDGGTNPSRVDGVLVVDVAGPGGTTLYARIGDAFGALTALVGVSLLMASFVPRRR